MRRREDGKTGRREDGERGRGSTGYTGYLTFRCLPDLRFSLKKKPSRCVGHIE